MAGIDRGDVFFARDGKGFHAAHAGTHILVKDTCLLEAPTVRDSSRSGCRVDLGSHLQEAVVCSECVAHVWWVDSCMARRVEHDLKNLQKHRGLLGDLGDA